MPNYCLGDGWRPVEESVASNRSRWTRHGVRGQVIASPGSDFDGSRCGDEAVGRVDR